MTASDLESLQAVHRHICEQLNVDAPTEARSWESYRVIRSSYNLDGDQQHWLCCSLFVNCRQTVTPTVGNRNAVLQGNCVSLTKLLRLCAINLHDFFSKIGQWVEMSSLPEEIRNGIETLQHSFKVSMTIYGKFCELFMQVFRPPVQDEQKRGKKSKPVPCSTNRLHNFCWTLFIYAKHEYPEQSVDVVTSNYMMIACLDLVFSNAIADGRRDIVNPDFEGLPEEFLTEGKVPLEPLCIIEKLCEDGFSSEALATKNTLWKDVIENLFQTKVLRGDANSFTGLISVENFDENMKSLNNRYETFILSCGEFDERIALNQKIGETPSSIRNKSEPIPLYQQTPLSGRSRINKVECNNIFTPISAANASVKKISMKLRYVGEPHARPHASLRELLISCTPDPIPIIKSRITAEREKFNRHMRSKNWNQVNTSARFDMIEAVYYYLLENIIHAEIRRRTASIVRQICCEDMFNRTLLVCSAEIVIYAHNLQQNFPWILEVFDLHPFFFYRVIELVIQNHNDLLTREIIKHLTFIEEQCVESLIWKSSSPLWTSMDNINYVITANQGVELSYDLSGITPHKPGDGSVTKSNGTVATKSEPVGPRINLSSLGFNSPLKLPVPNGSLSKQRPGTSSLNLFFRKFYGIAAVRMKELCNNLGLTNEYTQKQIWTLFEYSIMRCSRELMRDRHLDQMLMCAIYVFVKVTRLDNTFSDIMKFYRNQPQSNSHVYRSVFISRNPPAEQNQQQQQQQKNAEAGDREENAENRVPPADLAIMSMHYGSEERGDIIMFYNRVYVPHMQEYAIQFGNGDRQRSLILSPPPRTPIRSVMQSPKQIDARISLYVTPMQGNLNLKESPGAITYMFDRSPAKDLEKINRIVSNTNVTGCKRSLNDPESYVPSIAEMKPRRKNTKLDRLISDRQQ